jgi:predicted small lipoprotein YifL
MKRVVKTLVLALGLVWISGCGTPPEATPTDTVMPSTPTAEEGYPIQEPVLPTPNYPAPQSEPMETATGYPEPEE